MDTKTLRTLLIISLVIYYFPLMIVTATAIATRMFFEPALYGTFAANVCSSYDLHIKPLLRLLLAGVIAIFALRLRESGSPFFAEAKVPCIILPLGAIIALVLNAMVDVAKQPIVTTIYSEAYSSLISSTRGYMVESMAYTLTLLGFGFSPFRPPEGPSKP